MLTDGEGYEGAKGVGEEEREGCVDQDRGEGVRGEREREWVRGTDRWRVGRAGGIEGWGGRERLSRGG